MIKAYEQSSFTLNLIRSMINSGYTNILNAHNWDLDFIKNSMERVVTGINGTARNYKIGSNLEIL